jgi:hypothetical protein
MNTKLSFARNSLLLHRCLAQPLLAQIQKVQTARSAEGSELLETSKNIQQAGFPDGHPL